MRAIQTFFRTFLVLLALLLAGQNAWAKLTGEIIIKGNAVSMGNKYKCNLVAQVSTKTGTITVGSWLNLEMEHSNITFNNETFSLKDDMTEVCINGTIDLQVVESSDDFRAVTSMDDLTISLRQQANGHEIWFYEAIAYKGDYTSCKEYSVSDDRHMISVLLYSHPHVSFNRVKYQYVRNAPFSAENTTISGINDTYINDGVNRPVPTVIYKGIKDSQPFYYTLREDTDYDVSYSNTSGAGTARVTITGKGEYAGSRYVQYTIRNLALSDFTQNTADGTYKIATKEDLAKLAQLLSIARNNCANATFRQENDITCDNTYAPIGTETCNFCGTYDGNGKSLSGISVGGSSDYVGLFGVIGSGGTVKNVVLSSSSFVGSNWVGGIAGKNNGGTVQNCLVQGSVEIHTVLPGSWDHGGVVGLNSGTIAGCLCAASVKNNNNKTDCSEYGGIAGADNGGTIKDCIYTGSTITAASSIGAIVGNADNTTLVNNYYNTINLGGVQGIDKDGARLARTVTLGEKVSISGTQASYNVSGLTAIGTTALRNGNTIYSGEGQTLTLSVPTGYSGVYTARKTSGGEDITASVINGATLTMPAYDVTVTAVISVSATLDLTAYAGTVSGVKGYWTTFFHGTFNYQLPAGAQAFTMDSNHHLYRVGTDGRIIPAGKAVVIIAEASALTGVTAESGTLTLTHTNSDASINGTSILQGSDSPVTVSGPGGTPYVLGLVGGVLGFYKFTGETIPAQKAYYVVE